MKRILGAAAVASLAVATPAQSACWTDTAYQAAQIRNFETMMMVSMLRCRLVGNDFTATYNSFVRDKRPVLSAANEELRAQFAKTVGTAKAMNAYDDYMTKVANSYGAGNDGLSCRDFSSIVDAAAQSPATRGAVAALAERAGTNPRLPGARCGTSVALKGE